MVKLEQEVITLQYKIEMDLCEDYKNNPIKVSPIPIAAIHVICSFNTMTDVTTIMTGTI